MLTRLKQLFCRHDFQFQGNHKYIDASMYFCQKCRMYHYKHHTIDVSYNSTKFQYMGYL